MTRVSVDPIQRMTERMGRLFGDMPLEFPFGLRSLTLKPTYPALTVWEEPEQFVVEAELPGLELSDLEITMHQRELTISGERKDSVQDKAEFHLRERNVGRFSRSLRLPFDIDAARVSAELKNGVLTVRLPKAEAAKPRKIAVSAN